jgi:transposase
MSRGRRYDPDFRQSAVRLVFETGKPIAQVASVARASRGDQDAQPTPDEAHQDGRAPDLVAAFGIGPDIAAEMLITAGDNNDRIRSDAALAKLCGACPIPAGSGKTNGRYRLNRGRNRQANAALYWAIIVRMRWHPPTIAYAERRTAEGLSKKEIIRCLKRFLAREIYRLLPEPSSPSDLAAAA